MTLVGVVSDNHALIDPALASAMAGVELILHAGDLVGPEILTHLGAMAPVLAVRGNNDFAGPCADLPEDVVVERGGRRIFMRHIVGAPPAVRPEALAAIEAERADVVICGHSHAPLAVRWNGKVFVNPGSCGPRRFRLPRTAATLLLGEGRIEVTHIDLDTGARRVTAL